ncbi:hypothetical protein EX895_004247 [Sporisorium graminicola]|uniref:Zn(2)-C6 fungal-type domain-containing protein n=1 Tax=Sporisorium graminicola TaxID=280036 RepID=A0A4U7KTK3_9BASI|nr:hypothetical protein EX895_004247 [Sporisorium graminicola]TKY86608.1 hypothetical protein EX895_004247 [Sporisorium graminicola]
MCFSTLALHTPFTESESNSPAQPLAVLSSQLFASVPEAITSEGSTRKRVGRACEVCRRKKVKCNGQKPCSQCIAFAEECDYVEVKDRSAYSRRYVESLEARLACVENSVATLLQRQVHERTRQNLQLTQTMTGQGETGARTLLEWQRQVEQVDQAAVPRDITSVCRPEANLGLEHSSDLTSLSATYLIEQASATLQHQDCQYTPFTTSSGPIRMQASQQAQAFQKDTELSHEVGAGPMPTTLPMEADFLALLESYSQRIYPFFSIAVPSEVHSAWIRISSADHSLHVHSASELALVFAVLACGAQALPISHMSTPSGHLNSSTAPLSRYSSNDLDAHAQAWSNSMNEIGPRHPSEGSRHAQVHALLSFHAAGRGDSMLAFDYIIKARSVPALSASSPSDRHTGDERIMASIQLLDRIIRSSLGRMATQQQSFVQLQTWAPISENCPGMVSALHVLSTLCSESGSVGRTICDLLEPGSPDSPAEDLKTVVRDRDCLLLDWYSALPHPYRSMPSHTSDPTSSSAACIAFVSLQYERVRLHLALQHFARRATGGVSRAADDVDRCDLARCLHLSGETIRKFPIIAKCLQPNPWLVLYAQCLGASAAFLALTAVREPHCNVRGLLMDVEVAMAGLEQLEYGVQGVADVRTKLARLISTIKAQSEDSLDSRASKKREAADGGVGEGASVRSSDVVDKRIRAATLPQVGSQLAVSPIPRAETAPPVPLEQPPAATSLSASSDQASSTAMSMFYPPAPAPAGSSSVPWTSHDDRQASATEIGTFNAFWNSPSSNVGFASSQHQQQQHQQRHHSPVIPSQSQVLPFDLQQQQQLMAGLMGDYMLQDQHPGRQAG